jgi:hypothetical protein
MTQPLHSIPVGGSRCGLIATLLPAFLPNHELPQAANRVVGRVGLAGRVSDRVVGAELLGMGHVLRRPLF